MIPFFFLSLDINTYSNALDRTALVDKIKDLEYCDRFPCNILKEPSNLYFRLDWLLYLYSRVLFEVLSAQGIDLTGGAASLLFKQENDAEANKSKNSA